MCNAIEVITVQRTKTYEEKVMHTSMVMAMRLHPSDGEFLHSCKCPGVMASTG